MSSNLSIEDKNISVGCCLSQMIVGSAVTQAEFKERSWHVLNKSQSLVNAAALCIQSPDETVQSTHYRLLNQSSRRVEASRGNRGVGLSIRYPGWGNGRGERI